MKKRAKSPRAVSRKPKKAGGNAPPPAPESTGKPSRVGTVTLWGEVLEENDRELKMAVKNYADALDVGLSGTVWIAKRQIFGRVGHAEGYDFVRVSFAYASLLAQSCQQCE